jgi:hypothetical protein
MRRLTLSIECGDETCADLRRRAGGSARSVCRYWRTTTDRTSWCGLFGDTLTSGHVVGGWFLRCPACIAAEDV